MCDRSATLESLGTATMVTPGRSPATTGTIVSIEAVAGTATTEHRQVCAPATAARFPSVSQGID